jgi:hypothetical protein
MRAREVPSPNRLRVFILGFTGCNWITCRDFIACLNRDKSCRKPSPVYLRSTHTWCFFQIRVNPWFDSRSRFRCTSWYPVIVGWNSTISNRNRSDNVCSFLSINAISAPSMSQMRVQSRKPTGLGQFRYGDGWYLTRLHLGNLRTGHEGIVITKEVIVSPGGPTAPCTTSNLQRLRSRFRVSNGVTELHSDWLPPRCERSWPSKRDS